MTHPAEIEIARYPAARGAAWLREAFGMFSAARANWLLLLFAYYLVMALVDVVPLVGAIAVPVLKPVFAVGFLAAAWAQERGARPTLQLLFQGFRSNLWALLPLGVLLLVGITLAVRATSAVDGGKLLDVLAGRTPVDEEMLASGEVQRAMLFGAACALPILLALWFAPGLVVFHDCGAARALVLSLRACLLNWRALLVYALLVSAYAVIVPSIAMALVALILPSSIALPVTFVLVMPYVFVLVATLHVSDYVSYRDIFHAREKTAGEASPPPAVTPSG